MEGDEERARRRHHFHPSSFIIGGASLTTISRRRLLTNEIMASFQSSAPSTDTAASIMTATASDASTASQEECFVDARAYWTYRICVEDTGNIDKWDAAWLQAALGACETLARAKDLPWIHIAMPIPPLILRKRWSERSALVGSFETFAPRDFAAADRVRLAVLASSVRLDPVRSAADCDKLLEKLLEIALIACPGVTQYWTKEKAALEQTLLREHEGRRLPKRQDFALQAVAFLGSLLDDIQSGDEW